MGTTSWRLALGLVLLVAAGCKTQIRASNSFIAENRIEKIALFSEGMVVWPTREGEFFVGIQASQQALDAVNEHGIKVLEDLGYEVVMAEPVSIGSWSADWGVIHLDGSKSMSRGAGPVHRCEINKKSPSVARAAQRMFEAMEAAIRKDQLRSFTVSATDARLVKRSTGADTVCLVRVFGKKYTTRRKVGQFLADLGAAAAGAYSASSADNSDLVDVVYAFIDAESGEVLWQHNSAYGNDPAAPTVGVTKLTLSHFPSREVELEGERAENGLFEPD